MKPELSGVWCLGTTLIICFSRLIYLMSNSFDKFNI